MNSLAACKLRCRKKYIETPVRYLLLPRWGWIAQWWRSRISPNSPRFESHPSRNFSGDVSSMVLWEASLDSEQMHSSPKKCWSKMNCLSLFLSWATDLIKSVTFPKTYLKLWPPPLSGHQSGSSLDPEIDSSFSHLSTHGKKNWNKKVLTKSPN